MARRTPTMPISPTQLKHFAAATVALTLLLALFVGGEEASVAAQIQATQAKNELIAAEREKLGTKKLASNLKVRNQTADSFGSDEGGNSGYAEGGGGSVSGSAGPPQIGKRNRPAFMRPPEPESRPGSKTGRPQPMLRRSGGGEANPDDESGPGSGLGSAPAPDFSKLAAVKEASRQRSGGSASSD